ncbi:MAG TPA: LuxR C-terminal-related transcriptional regulator [bacterium]|nr:LuxR C-terminal-related transcriptional regulator [bacterium]
MLTQGEQEKLNSEILRASYEALTLEDMGSQILPLIDRLLDTSTSLLFRCNDQGKLLPIAGSLIEGHYIYAKEYLAVDPMQRALRRLNPWILHAASVPEWAEWHRKHPAHTECSTHYGFDNFLHLRLNDSGMHGPGMVGMVLARTDRQPDFSERERMILGGMLPALEALVRRSSRLDERLRSQPFLESMLDFSPQPSLALDSSGALLWASDRAGALLSLGAGKKALPEALSQAARRLADLAAKGRAPNGVGSSISIPRSGSAAIPAELRLVRSRGGGYFVVADLEDPEISPHLADLAARHRLTAAETQVLKLLALGLTDREIGRRLFVASTTVHSHVTHLLAKLGLNSRFQAALLANGLKPFRSDDEE